MATPKITHVFDTSVDLAIKVEQTIKRTGKTKSEVLREALTIGLDKVEPKPEL